MRIVATVNFTVNFMEDIVSSPRAIRKARKPSTIASSPTICSMNFGSNASNGSSAPIPIRPTSIGSDKSSNKLVQSFGDAMEDDKNEQYEST